MPSMSELFEPTESFTILPSDGYSPLVGLPPPQNLSSPFLKRPAPRNVNVVKPVQRAAAAANNNNNNNNNEAKKDFSFRVIADEDKVRQQQDSKRRKRKPAAAEMPVHSQTILDPHFSRNLDLKLRRLKEKEIIAERLSKRTKERHKAMLAEPTVIPKINIKSVPPRQKNLSVSQPNLNTLKPNVVNLEIPNQTAEKKTQTESNASPGTGGKTPDKSGKSNGPSKKGSKTNVAASDKPLFITTVRKGEFLPPPASMATLLGMSSCERTSGVPTLMYSYASRPKVVGLTATTRKASVEEVKVAKGGLAHLTSLAMTVAGLANRAGQSVYGNLMSEKRVVRGTTTTLQGTSTEIVNDATAAARGARAIAARRRAVARRRGPGVPGVPGVASWSTSRRHEPVQTDPYLEELYDKGQEMEIGIQTDLNLERVETPQYVPAKNGHDAATQILPGELFDFEIEVEPILEVLVENTIEVALAECLEEEQLTQARIQNAAAAELRAQEQESALFREQQLQVIQREKKKDEIERPEGSAALNLVKEHLSPLLPEVIEPLKVQGLISDKNEEIDETFLPWLMSEVSHEVENMITNRGMLIDIVKEVIETRAELYRAMLDDENGENSSNVVSTLTSNESQIEEKKEEED